MLVTLREVKDYLRIDTDDEDEVVASLMQNAETLCKDVARVEKVEDFEALGEVAKQAVLYSTAYLYEHRENADYHQMTLMLRALLFGVRREGF
ncbi:MAG TPA: head-tail connector protein [Veillonellaceae bacterium]|uniref:head-tail connector protein n=1 Tax=Dialister hominis TaxID=2582419 RepID=UPI00352028C4|nr:head-tail connector protein [Veillonellaceae bacterium]